MPTRLPLLLATLAGLFAGLLTAPSYAVDSVTNLTPPTVSGQAAVGGKLRSKPGTWDPAEVSVTHQWLRDGKPMRGKTWRNYAPRPANVGHKVAVRVRATGPDGGSATATSRAVRIKKGTFVVKRRTRLEGAPKYLAVLTAKKPRLKPRPTTVKFRWLRDGKPIKGATKRTYRAGWQDVGHKVRVRVTGKRAGYRARTVKSPNVRIRHRVPVRNVVNYHVETRGKLTTSVKAFRKLAHASLNDPRGWRGSGIKFREVAKGGSMTLVLAEASWLPRFSSGCSAQWSCRVGRYVIINQLRWKHASPAWNGAGGSLRGYRHMVVNHETGHWLGWGHRSCPKRGAKAPVMQQQSIGLQGCRFNAFPTPAERNVPRF